MIPVDLFDEPKNFDELVRIPGNRFLLSCPNPSTAEFNKHNYWVNILPDARRLYKGICNYCATWIPASTGGHSIDHFKNKSQYPELAYEWHNYRYASPKFNAKKGQYVIIDPIGLIPNSFVLNFANFHVEVNDSIADLAHANLCEATINILGLNEDEALITERSNYVLGYQIGEYSFDYLKKQAPFIAIEIERQGFKSI
jgi:hypothetical protein